MPNSIKDSGILPTKFVSALSRYANSQVVYYGPKNKLTFTTYKKQPNQTTEEDKFMVIKTDYRPDLVSKEVYGVVDFWWKILEANNMKDIYEFKSGVSIRLPGNIF